MAFLWNLTDRFPEDVDDVMRDGIASMSRMSGDERFCDHDDSKFFQKRLVVDVCTILGS
jgi:hypothetical protein